MLMKNTAESQEFSVGGNFTIQAINRWYCSGKLNSLKYYLFCIVKWKYTFPFSCKIETTNTTPDLQEIILIISYILR